MQYMPRALLFDSERSAIPARRNAVAAIGDHPDRNQPLIETERAVLKDGADLDRKLSSAALFAALE